jgi:branched-chain amino acid transport system ATP-binding protein
LGIARTFQNIRLFHNMTAMENVMVARHCRTRSEFFSTIFMTPSYRRQEQDIQKSARDLLTDVGLLDRGNALAKNLPYGEQRRLELARALALEPKLLLLDEPTAGMNPTESEALMRLVERIQKRGIAILLIEHQMRVVMNLCHRVVVLDYGAKIADAAPAEVQKNTAVIEAYLGTSAHA